MLVDTIHPNLSIRRQCDLLGLPRSSYYYEPVVETPTNLHLMRLIDEQYLRTPYLGYPRMTVYLQRLGFAVNEKRVYRLMRRMGLQAVYPRPKTSGANKAHQIYPYLLKDVAVEQPNFVWCADITYVPVVGGFMYLVAIMDWYSRYVLSWELSNSLDRFFCLDALDVALATAQPTIFNTDQGAQFTSHDFTGRLKQAGIQISMDGRGRMMDNIFIERLWRSVKYEDIYLRQYETVPQLFHGLTDYFTLYNEFRPHQALNYATPAEVHFGNGQHVLKPRRFN